MHSSHCDGCSHTMHPPNVTLQLVILETHGRKKAEVAEFRAALEVSSGCCPACCAGVLHCLLLAAAAMRLTCVAATNQTNKHTNKQTTHRWCWVSGTPSPGS